jgi:putative tricarboxylic transport membrane protein
MSIIHRALLTTLTMTGVLLFASAAPAQTWKPSRNVELIVAVSPGGGIDRMARTLQNIIQELRLVEVPVTVINKPGGGGTIAQAYLSQRAGDGHFIEITATSLLTNHIIGRSTYDHHAFTPIAMLSDEYIGFLVRADSPLKTGKDLLAQFKSNPDALPIGIATAAGNTNHIAAALVAKAAGADIKKLKVVVFSSGGEAMTALLGGHVGLVTTPSANSIPHLQNGRMRVLAIASPKRLEGPLSVVPTWKEQGVDAVVANWRPVIAPKGLTPAQISYWEDVFAKVVQTPGWKAEIEKSGAVANFMKSRELAAHFIAEQKQFRSILGELGLAKDQ